MPQPALSRLRERTILTWGIALTVGLACATTAAHLVDYGAYDLHVRALDTNTRASVFGVISLFALAVAFAAAAITAARVPEQRVHGALLAAALGILLVLRIVHPAEVVALALPLIAAAFVLLWSWRAEDVRACRVLRAGCLLLAASLVLRRPGFDALESLGYDDETWANQTRVALKHASELAGWVLVATALLASARHSGPRERR